MTKEEQIATSVAKRYKRRCWWADLEDLINEAYAAVLSAKEKADSTRPWEPYAYTAAMHAVRSYLWQNTSPVNETCKKVDNLRGAHRAELTEDIELQRPSAYELLTRHQWLQRVKQRLEELSVVVPDGNDALDFILDEDKRAADYGDPAIVYKASSALRRHISRDTELYELWQAQV